MFKGNSPFGLDLAAFNIQRGRDIALRPYNDYVQLIGNNRITNFAQLSNVKNLYFCCLKVFINYLK